MTKMRIGYAKFGRSMTMDPSMAGFQGDQEAPQLLRRLAERNPDVTWVLVGRNRGNTDIPNIENPWKDAPPRPPVPAGVKIIPYDDFEFHIRDVISNLDACIVHMGQHGTSHISLPFVGKTWKEAEENERYITKPLLWAQSYGRYLTMGLNKLGDRTDGTAPIVWTCTDPRNYMKARDVKWPTGLNNILAQYDYTRTQKQERFNDFRTPHDLGFGDWCESLYDGSTWAVQHRYRYADLELMILPDNWSSFGLASFHDRKPVGIASTSYTPTYNNEPRRSEIIRDVILNCFPDAEIYGKWDSGSLADVPDGTVKQNQPSEFFDILNSWRVSLALPALGSSWTVAKPYQLFASRVVGFMYQRLDDQGWVLPSRRRGPDTSLVSDEYGVPLYSIRNDWTAQDCWLAAWLRVETPGEFHARAHIAASDPDVWTQLTSAQISLLSRRRNAHYLENLIELQLGLHRG